MATNNILNSPVPFEASKGGTGVSTLTTTYGVLCGGTTSTAPVQNAGAGTAGQVLLSNGASSLPTFQTVNPGGYTFISSATASASATIEFAPISGYKNYMVYITNMRPTNSNTFVMQVSDDGGSTWTSGSDYQGSAITGEGATDASFTFNSTSRFELLESLSPNAAEESFFIITLNNIAATSRIITTWQGGGLRTSGAMQVASGGGLFDQVASIDGIRFFMSIGTMTTVTFRLYGVSA